MSPENQIQDRMDQYDDALTASEKRETALTAQLAERDERIAELVAACKPLLDAPGCNWCGNVAVGFTSRLDGQQQGHVCENCLALFGDDAVMLERYLPDVSALRAALTRATSSKTNWFCGKCLWSGCDLTKQEAISLHKGANKTLRVKCGHEPIERNLPLPPESSEVLG